MRKSQTEHDLVLHSQNVSRFVVVRDSIITLVIWVVWFALCEGFIVHVIDGLKNETTEIQLLLDLFVIFIAPLKPYLVVLAILILLLSLGAWGNRKAWLLFKASAYPIPLLGLKKEAAYFSTNPEELKNWKSTRSIELTLDEQSHISEVVVHSCVPGD